MITLFPVDKNVLLLEMTWLTSVFQFVLGEWENEI